MCWQRSQVKRLFADEFLTCVRNSFGNQGDAIKPEEVRRIRSEAPAAVANSFE